MKAILILALSTSLFTFSQGNAPQTEREKFPTTFAVQLRGLANNRIIEGPLEMNNGTVLSTIGMRNGFSFGGIIRRRFTDNLGIELGLNHNKRFYDLSGTILASNDTYNSDFAFTNYELPLNGVAFVRLSNQFFASAGLGVSAIFKPSSIESLVVDRVNDKRFIFAGFADKSKFNFNVNAQFGFEFRTDNSGTIYIGGSASVPTAPLFEFISYYSDEDAGINTYQSEDIRSPYFTLDIRFFFPKINNKGVQPNKGPIE